jgi:hypothetical protein
MLMSNVLDTSYRLAGYFSHFGNSMLTTMIAIVRRTIMELPS